MEHESALDQPVLCLNSAWMPVGVVSTRRSIEDMTSLSEYGDAPKLALDIIMEDDVLLSAIPKLWEDWIMLPVRDENGNKDDFIPTAHGRVRAPTVLICQHFGRIPFHVPNLNATAIFERDDFTCQFCGRRLSRKQLNLDHVFPESRGGKKTWTNLVTSCIRCNTKKGDRTPQEAGMHLIRRPMAPKTRPLTFHFSVAKHPHWRPFLQHSS